MSWVLIVAVARGYGCVASTVRSDFESWQTPVASACSKPRLTITMLIFVCKEVTAAYRVALDPLFDALLGMTKVVEMTGSESCLTQLSGLPLLYAHDERRYSAFLSYSMTIDHFGMSHCCASTALPVVGL